MLFYFEKQIETVNIGGRVVGVACNKCGCEYFFELTRIGTGIGTAHYGIGTASATRSAREQSQHDLRQRLALEAELVPCPKCNWINDELVQGYRLGRYRRLGMLALGVGFFGTVGSLICAWFISIGPAIDRVALPYFLFYGPLLFVSFAIGMILLRSWMRSRIEPNRNFPLAPKLPRGSPPALLADESSGQLRPAAADESRGTVPIDWHDFQIGRHSFPPLCCGCLQIAAMEFAYKQPVSTAIDLEVPRCADCANNSKRAFRRIWWTVAAIGSLVGTGVIMPLNLESFEFWIIIVAYLLILIGLASFVASTATSPVKITIGDESRGVLRLRFRNAEYGQLVARHLTDRTMPSAGVPESVGE